MSEPPAAPDEGNAAVEAAPSASAGESGPPLDSKKLIIGFTWRFLVTAALLSTAVYIDEVLFEAATIQFITSNTASAVGATMTFFGFPTEVSGSDVIYDARVYRIIEECVGLDVLELFAAATLAFPVAWKDRLRGLLVGLPILFFLNFIRMITLVLLGSKSKHALEIGHLYVWPLIVIAVAIGLWLSWAWSATDEASSAA